MLIRHTDQPRQCLVHRGGGSTSNGFQNDIGVVGTAPGALSRARGDHRRSHYAHHVPPGLPAPQRLVRPLRARNDTIVHTNNSITDAIGPHGARLPAFPRPHTTKGFTPRAHDALSGSPRRRRPGSRARPTCGSPESREIPTSRGLVSGPAKGSTTSATASTSGSSARAAHCRPTPGPSSSASAGSSR